MTNKLVSIRYTIWTGPSKMWYAIRTDPSKRCDLDIPNYVYFFDMQFGCTGLYILFLLQMTILKKLFFNTTIN